jgi:hypothetical protein
VRFRSLPAVKTLRLVLSCDWSVWFQPHWIICTSCSSGNAYGLRLLEHWHHDFKSRSEMTYFCISLCYVATRTYFCRSVAEESAVSELILNRHMAAKDNGEEIGHEVVPLVLQAVGLGSFEPNLVHPPLFAFSYISPSLRSIGILECFLW